MEPVNPASDAKRGGREAPSRLGGPITVGANETLGDVLHRSMRELRQQNPEKADFLREAARLFARAGNLAAAVMLEYVHPGRLTTVGGVGADAKTLEVLLSRAGRWIALRCISERQVRVVECAHTNTFVPQQLIVAFPGTHLGIASLPIMHQGSPVGVLVLFSTVRGAFSQRLLTACFHALEVCAPMLRQIAGPPPENDSAPRAAALRRAAIGAVGPPAAAPPGPAAATARPAADHSSPGVPRLLRKLDQELHDTRDAAESAWAQVTTLQTAVTQLQHRLESSAGAIRSLTRERDEMRAALGEAMNTIRRQGAANIALQARLNEALDPSRADRDPRSLERRVSEAESALAQERESWNARIGELEQERDRARDRLLAFEHEAASLREEVARLQGALENAESALAAMSGEIERRKSSQTAQAVVSAEIAALSDLLRRRESELDAQRDQIAALAASDFEWRTLIETLQGAHELEEKEKEAALDAAQRRATELEEELRLMADAVARQRAEISYYRNSVGAVPGMAIGSLSPHLTAPGPAPGHSPAGAGESCAEHAAATGEQVLILDDARVARKLASELCRCGIAATDLTPDPQLGIDLGQRAGRGTTAVNLAIPSSWGAVRRLCWHCGAPTSRLVGYALAPGSSSGFWIGPVSFAIMHGEDARLADVLRCLVPGIERAVVISPDAPLLTQVREELSGAAIAAELFPNGERAVAALRASRPQAAVVHLSAHYADACKSVWDLRSSEASRDIPILFILDANAQPQDVACFTEAMCRLGELGNLGPDALVESLASSLSAE